MIKHRMRFFQRRWLQQSLENDLSFEIVNKINKIVLVLKAVWKFFIISFQTNLHAFFPPFVSCPYYCLCITFKSDIYKYVQLRIKTVQLSVLSVLWLCYPSKIMHGNKKMVLCLKSMFIFRRNVHIVFTTYLEFSCIIKNISCRTLKSYSKFLVVSLITFTDTLYNFAQTM